MKASKLTIRDALIMMDNRLHKNRNKYKIKYRCRKGEKTHSLINPLQSKT